MQGLILAEAASEWHYGAWVALDLRLLIFVVLISILASVGVTLLSAKRRNWVEYAALAIVSFTGTFILFVFILNAIADYPVFAVRSVFTFP